MASSTLVVAQIRLAIYVCIVNSLPQEKIWRSWLAHPLPTHHDHDNTTNTTVRDSRRENRGVVDGIEAVSLEEWCGTHFCRRRCSFSILSNRLVQRVVSSIVVDCHRLVVKA